MRVLRSPWRSTLAARPSGSSVLKYRPGALGVRPQLLARSIGSTRPALTADELSQRCGVTAMPRSIHGEGARCSGAVPIHSSTHEPITFTALAYCPAVSD